MNVLQTRKITKRYGTVAAVDNVSLAIRKGDIYGLIGRNGAGKTTLMRMITALTFPTGGELELFGKTDETGLNNSRIPFVSFCFIDYIIQCKS